MARKEEDMKIEDLQLKQFITLCISSVFVRNPSLEDTA
jgi:hypothetical protein